MPLFTKCMKCGGWRLVPEEPSGKGQFPTGLMMNAPQAPSRLCSCDPEPSTKPDP